jgi:regulator of sirC expression with transglutaminase-like and TPR domain
VTRATSIGALRSLLESPLATVEDGALIIARDARPSLDLAQTRARLDALADATSARLDRSSTIQEQLAVLADVLYRTAGLRGNRADYNDPRNSYVPDVLERRLGIPVSLAVIISAVARRAGVVADILGFPGHVLVVERALARASETANWN